MSNDPKRPVALVTGTSSGIGQSIGRFLLASGWDVVGFDVAPAAIESASFKPVRVDLTDCAAAQAAAREHAYADALVHAAGVLRVGRLGELNAADFGLMWSLHVAALASIADILGPAMHQRGAGRIVLVGSRVAQGMPGRSQYAATKAALIALARSWAGELIEGGVTVNVVSPAATETAMLQDPARSGSAPRLPPLGRLIRPDEIASLVAYLLSPAADAITGQDIQICGGASLPR